MYYVGIDLGTSGVRACAIDAACAIIAETATSLPAPQLDGERVSQDPALWWQAVQQVLGDLLARLDPSRVQAISVDGTSGTLLVTDRAGQPLAPALMYNDASCRAEAEQVARAAPEDSPARGASSGLARLLHLCSLHPQAAHALHQADWIAGRLSGRYGISDANNALKTGYDPVREAWPDWLGQLPLDTGILPRVQRPGSVIGEVSAATAKAFGLAPTTRVVAGTTDSIAAFIATGASKPGEAVTSLGSTLVVKIITERPVYSAPHGVYSHRLGDHWLAGGASNSGGAVLKKYFSDDELQALTPRLQPEQPTGLDYYPLARPGERFPVNDASLQPKLQPEAPDPLTFFQAMLEGMASIEQQAYRRLHELGAPSPVSVLTAGGGSVNDAWTAIRQSRLGIPVYRAEHSQACYGSALLALRATQS